MDLEMQGRLLLGFIAFCVLIALIWYHHRKVYKLAEAQKSAEVTRRRLDEMAKEAEEKPIVKKKTR